MRRLIEPGDVIKNWEDDDVRIDEVVHIDAGLLVIGPFLTPPIAKYTALVVPEMEVSEDTMLFWYGFLSKKWITLANGQRLASISLPRGATPEDYAAKWAETVRLMREQELTEHPELKEFAESMER